MENPSLDGIKLSVSSIFLKFCGKELDLSMDTLKKPMLKIYKGECVISMHRKIIKILKNKSASLIKYKEIRKFLEKMLDDNTRKIVEEIDTIINTIMSNKELPCYLAETVKLINKYKTLISKPIEVNFFRRFNNNNEDNNENKEINLEKEKIMSKYLSLIKKYVTVYMISQPKKPGDLARKKSRLMEKFKVNNFGDDMSEDICDDCGNKNMQLIDDALCVCENCGMQKKGSKKMIQYMDINRVTTTGKSSHEKISHFEDIIANYQGKQFINIPQKVIQDLQKQISENYLICKGIGKEKYKNVTKGHIMGFLKQLNYTKFYRNSNLIYQMVTGKPLDDITYLEKKLLEDIRELISYFDDKDKIYPFNGQHLLFQLLKKHRHSCNKRDFNILKSIDRQWEYEQVYEKAFSDLGWNYTSII